MPYTAPVTRHFLGWDRPLLFAAVDHLLSVPGGGELDLSGTIVVTPGRRASRMLNPMIAQAAHRAGRPLSPPRWVTPGDLAGSLLGPRGRSAGPLARRLAWIEALRSIPAPELAPLVPHSPDRPEAWGAIAEQLERTSDELAGDLLTFREVAGRAPGLIDDLEAARWSAAAKVQAAYETSLRAQGLLDDDLGRARALSGELHPGSQVVVLIGVTELSRAARTALERLPARVDALIHAPEPLASRFDDLGCIIPDRWKDVAIDIPDDRLIFADSPHAQAAHALASLAGPPLSPTDVAIGVPDHEVAPCIRRLAARTGQVTVRDAAGRPMADSAPCRLLRAVADYLDRRSFAKLSTLVRHPDFERWLLRTLPGPRGAEWWLAAMDDFAAGSLCGRLEDDWPSPDERTVKTVRLVAGAADRLLAALGSQPRTPRDWAAPIASVLRAVYEGASAKRSGPAGTSLIEASQRLAAMLADLGAVPSRAGDSMSASQAVRLVLGALNEALPPHPDVGAIEMVGWLELPLDPASTVIVTGMNEEHVSSAVGHDPLLPDSLRRALGLPSADRRLARDAFLLTGLLASRRCCILIAGRRSADDDPLKPSRLLLAAPADTMLARLRRFFGDHVAPPPRIGVRIAPGPTSRFPRSPRIPTPCPEGLSVTAFRDFLASPYVFYLKHILGLQHRDQPADELDALSYGGLMHHVLEQFGRSDVNRQTDAIRIRKFLDDALAQAADVRFGRRRAGAVDLQLELLRLRLDEFARRQGAWRSQGWLIEQIEWPPDRRTVLFDVDGVPIRLSGRIDRIDRHGDGRIAILDYKSGNRVDSPGKTHRNRSGWTDLQLPLYRHLAADLGLPEDPGRIVFGYFAIPRDPGKTEVLSVPWLAPDLESADEQARQIIRRVRDGDFADIGRPPPDAWVFEILAGQTFPETDEDEEEEGPE